VVCFLQVISRRLHKFFNIGELPETESERVDISRPHVILEKMDGYHAHILFLFLLLTGGW